LALCWIAAVGGVLSGLISVKLFFLLEYWLMAASAFAVCRFVARPLALGLLPPVAFFGGIALASFGRQMVYEILTTGHVTTLYDRCRAVLLNYAQFAGLVVELSLAGACAGVVSLLPHQSRFAVLNRGFGYCIVCRADMRHRVMVGLADYNPMFTTWA
jgi:hypothetical protein